MALNFTNETMEEMTNETMEDIYSETNNTSTASAMTFAQYQDMIINLSKGILAYQVGWWTNRIMNWALTLIALICNSLSLLTITKISPFTSSSLYIAVLAICDTLVMVIRLLIQQLDIWEVDLGEYGCGIIVWVSYVLLHVGIWIIVVMTFERFVAVWYPFRVAVIFSMTKTKISIVALFVIFTGLNAHNIWTIYLRDSGTVTFGVFCSVRPESLIFMYEYWYWVNSAVFSLGPCSILLILNVLIIYRMKKSLQKQKEMMHDNTGAKDAQQRQITIMLLSISFSYIVFFIPVTAYSLFGTKYNPWTSAEVFAEYFLVARLVYLFNYISHAVNFFFYFASSKKFRTVLFQMLGCKSSKKDSYQSQQTGSSMINTVSLATTSRQ